MSSPALGLSSSLSDRTKRSHSSVVLLSWTLLHHGSHWAQKWDLRIMQLIQQTSLLLSHCSFPLESSHLLSIFPSAPSLSWQMCLHILWLELSGIDDADFLSGPGCQGSQCETILMHDAWAINQLTARRMMGCTNFMCAAATHESVWLLANIWMRLLHLVSMAPKQEQTDNLVTWQRSMRCQQKGLTDAFSFLHGRGAYLYVSVMLWVKTFGTSETSFQRRFECHTSHDQHWFGKHSILTQNISS